MPRISRNTDQALIRAALEMMPRTGLSGLRVRAVARRAGVNLGMFHYYFKTKREFNRRVLEQLYESFFAKLVTEVEAAGGESPRERLRRALATVAIFARDRRELLLAIVKDVLEGNREVVAFLKKNVPRHMFVFIRLIRDCQKSGFIRRIPLATVLPILFGSIAAPVFAMALMGRISSGGLLILPFRAIARTVLSDRSVNERVDYALNALSPRFSMKGGAA